MRKVIVIFFVIFAISHLYAERPIVSAINAEVKAGNRVYISWQLPLSPDSEITNLILYRSTRPITSSSIIYSAKPLAQLSPTENSYVDTLPDFLSYYYAIITVTKDEIYEVVLPAFNSTVTGVKYASHIQSEEPIAETLIKEKSYPAGTTRESPLPPISTKENRPHRTSINSAVKNSVADLMAHAETKKSTQMSPFIFEIDYFAPNGGDDYFLFEILHRTFAKRNYAQAIDELLMLTGTNLNDDVVNRGTFYMGQSYFFTGDYASAIRCFLATSDTYKELSSKWIDASLHNLTYTTN